MLFSLASLKTNPFIKQIRKEFEFSRKTRRNPCENYWFCLKPAEKLEYMLKNKILLENNVAIFQEKSAETTNSRNFSKGFARKTGKCAKNAGNHAFVAKTREITKKIRKTRHFIAKKPQFVEKTLENKQIVIEIEDD